MRTAIFLGCYLIAYQIKPIQGDSLTVCSFIAIIFFAIDVLYFIRNHSSKNN